MRFERSYICPKCNMDCYNKNIMINHKVGYFVNICPKCKTKFYGKDIKNIYIIKKLNKNGIKTIFSCCGHFEHRDSNASKRIKLLDNFDKKLSSRMCVNGITSVTNSIPYIMFEYDEKLLDILLKLNLEQEFNFIIEIKYIKGLLPIDCLNNYEQSHTKITKIILVCEKQNYFDLNEYIFRYMYFYHIEKYIWFLKCVLFKFTR